jgi:LmbE family N-acetylglucosaminyl deacetylase
VVAAAGAVEAGGAPVKPLVLPHNPRVLVFSPHPDDETLGAGGLIARLVRQRAAVRVAFITNGDGWPWAAQEEFSRKTPTDSDYVALGELRQREALAATRRLGLKRHDVRFLGFPDGGLAELWRNHWSRALPYTSPFTKEDQPPYAGTESPDAEYDGQDLTSVITRLLREMRPTVVVIPHPYDTHPDHAHTGYFVTEALDALQSRHVLRPNVMVLTYLVHNPLWPPGLHGMQERLVPPSTHRVPDTIWKEIVLSPEELGAKTSALSAYRSQIEASADLLHRFLRPNEVFGMVKSKLLGRIAATH